MTLHSKETGSQLFTLRVWAEETDEGHKELRGKVQRVLSGETLYFHDWEAMEAFLLACLEEVQSSRFKVQSKEDLEL